MFITENQNVGDSVLFLLSSRAALANIVEASGTENAPQLVSFINNEASDYEIMNLLLNGSLPDEKYNDVAEMLLFSNLKESVMMNKDFVTEMVGEDIFENILYEVDSLYMQYSTARPILEFQMNEDVEIAIASMIHEAGGNIGNAARSVQAKIAAAKAAAAKKAAMAANATRMKGGAGAPSYLARGKGIAGKKVAAGKAAVAQKYALGKTYAGKAGAAIKHQAGLAAKSAKATAASAKLAGQKLVAKAQGPVSKFGTRAGTKVGGTVKGTVKGVAGKVTNFAGTKVATVGGKAVSAGAAAGGAAAAAMAIYAGAKIYKRFFSQAAKACGGQSGDAKTSCMNKYKKGAIMKQAAAIQSASGTCAKSKNPEKCKAGVATKVQSLKAKAAQIAA